MTFINNFFKLISVCLCLHISSALLAQGIAINTSASNPDNAAILDVSSTSKGLLLPRMTSVQRDAVDVTGNPEGLLIFNTDRCCFEFYANGSWHGMGCECGKVTFTYNDLTVTYGTVKSTGCKCWLDRNLGASQVATSSTDVASYGDLFQWGRGTDGHQIRTSGITSALSSSDNPGHGNFITANSLYDWRSPQNDNLWQGVSGINNPCPSGWRVPTDTEWTTEHTSWISQNEAGAIASPLKLPMAGNRSRVDGSLQLVGFYGGYWSSTVINTHSYRLRFGDTPSFEVGPSYRAYGFSVRCIKD